MNRESHTHGKKMEIQKKKKKKKKKQVHTQSKDIGRRKKERHG